MSETKNFLQELRTALKYLNKLSFLALILKLV